ncbi:hypothetical protein POM88_047562 [Heracleum sosnowskyi]|uniref:Uncharacterized protein n=1 Tax=Heracleum sosnowskyi TaxID=360622 RepID=A0AAD8GTI3_9APIA|nr:hypothetical protein POM88_047562 [Heracleum sosnowskyi]
MTLVRASCLHVEEICFSRRFRRKKDFCLRRPFFLLSWLLSSVHIKHLFDLLTCPDRRIVKVALQGLENLLKVGEAEKNLGDIKSTDIKLLCDLLTCPDLRIVKVALQGLENLLKVGEAEKNLGDENVYLQLLAEADGGLEKIENLLRHDDYEVYKKAVLLLDMYWLDDAD